MSSRAGTILLWLVLWACQAWALAVPAPDQAQEMQAKLDQVEALKQKLQGLNELWNNADSENREKIAELQYQTLLEIRKLRQETIVLVDRYYKLEEEGKNSAGEPQYDDRLAYEGSTNSQGKIRIGEKAFHSLATLLSTKLHEFVHANQVGEDWPKSEKARLMAEIEAYSHELEQAGATGLSQAEVESLSRRLANLRAGLSPTNRARVDHGQFRAEAVPIREAVERGAIELKLEGQGIAAGSIFRARIRRLTPEPFTLEVALGTPLRPDRPDVQTMMVGEDQFVILKDSEATVELSGYCLEPQKSPPPRTGVQWTVVNPCEEPDRYLPPARAIEAGRRLASAGRFHTDLPPAKYRDTVIQRALWHLAEPTSFDKRRLHRDISEQVTGTGGRQTPVQVQELADHLWEDVDLTLKESGTFR